MTDWNLVVKTIADFARIDVDQVVKLLNASHLQAQNCFSEVSAKTEEKLSIHRAAWNWIGIYIFLHFFVF